MDQLFDVRGRTALVTGSSRGLGLTIARGLAQAGATVVLNGRNQEQLARATESLAADGLSAWECAFDVADANQVCAGIEQIMQRPARSTCWSTTPGLRSRAR